MTRPVIQFPVIQTETQLKTYHANKLQDYISLPLVIIDLTSLKDKIIQILS